MPQKLARDVSISLQNFNSDHGTAWDFGENWSNVETEFETYINKYLFPKINETALINVELGNRFDWLAKEVDFIGQYSEEYVIMDSIPVSMNLSKPEELMLKRNYPQMATKLYQTGPLKKVKFTLNNNDVRLNFLTLKDGIQYAVGVYKKKVSDINVTEEQEIKGMLVDYALNLTKDVREVTSRDDLANQIFNALLNLQNNSAKYNETNEASGGTIGRYTTYTPLENVAILTNDVMKTFLLDTKIANTFQIKGLDITKHVISFDDLGGVYKTTEDVQIEESETLEAFRAYGDYQMQIGDVLPKGTVLTFDITTLTEFATTIEELKPETDMFAYIFDVNKLRYKRNTKGMIKDFYNPEFDETNYWLHYHTTKHMSPFFNNIRIGE